MRNSPLTFSGPWLVLALVFAGSVSSASLVQAKSLSVLVPSENQVIMRAQSIVEWTFVKRQGQVDLVIAGPNDFMQLSAGDELNITFFDDARYTILVTRVQTRRTGGVTLFGQLAGEELNTFSLTAENSGFRLTLRDMPNRLKYRVSGSFASGGGMVQEMDVAMLPTNNDVVLPAPPEPR